jgi:hypothetical protein
MNIEEEEEEARRTDVSTEDDAQQQVMMEIEIDITKIIITILHQQQALPPSKLLQ